MKNFRFLILLGVFYFLFIGFARTQINTGIFPESFYNKTVNFEEIDHITINPPNMEKIIEEDLIDEKNGTMMKIARLLPIDINLSNSGTWLKLENGTYFWRLQISSEGAQGSALHFDKFLIPEGAEFYAFDIDRSYILGPFTNSFNPDGDEYMVGILPGGNVIIEYYPPNRKVNEKSFVILPDLELTRFSYLYRGAENFLSGDKSTGYGSSGSCMVNVNCAAGDNWRTQQRGVARVYVVEGMFGGYCTGSLVNNTSFDGTPYFLLADHCGSTASTANFNQWQFRFNYESPGCQHFSEPTYNQFVGATKIAQGPLNGGSDFMLVRIKNITQDHLKNINAVYNGWRRTTGTSLSGVSIHHPRGDIKKISTYTSTLIQQTYYGQDETGASGAHWRVVWANTPNGHSVTDVGSSGSPIFDSNGLIIGTLSGGSSACNALTSPDLYGKFSYHWASNGTNDNQQLKPWLDPNNTGETSIPYFDPAAETLTANFSASPTSVNTGGSVQFTDESTGNITTRTWSFPGGTPSSSTLTNPSIIYNSPGSYNVSLSISDGVENVTETKNGYIYVSDDPCTGIINFPYTQVFNNANLPECWTQQTTISNYSWQTSTGYTIGDFNVTPQSGSRFYYCPWVAQNQNEWLITPSFDFSVSPNPEISFYFNGSPYWSVSPNNNCDLNLMVSVNGGTWTSIWSETDHPNFTDDNSYIWLQTVKSLSAYSGQSNVKFAFRYTGNDGANFAIDNVRVNGTSVQLYSLTVSTEGQGSVKVNGNAYTAPVSVQSGTVLSVEAFPASQWEFGNWTGALSGSTNPANITMNSNKILSANFIDVSSVESNDSKNQIQVYPNPTDGRIYIDLPGEGKGNVELINILGKRIAKYSIYGTNNELNLEQFATGMYLLEIRYEDIRQIKKITIR